MSDGGLEVLEPMRLGSRDWDAGEVPWPCWWLGLGFQNQLLEGD